MSDFLDDPILLVVAVGIGLTLLCLFFAFADDGDKKQAKRIERLKTRGQAVPSSEAALQLRRELGDRNRIDAMVRRLLPNPDLLRERLSRTGRKISLGSYGLSCLVVALVATAGIVTLGGYSLALAAPIGMLAGLWLPHLFVKFLVNRRTNRFAGHFPEAIALMVRGIKSGLPVTETFNIVANETPDPVGTEFRQISDQIPPGPPGGPGPVGRGQARRYARVEIPGCYLVDPA